MSIAYLFPMFFMLLGCSTVQKLGLNTTADILHDASSEIETESSFHFFEKSVPANIKQIEGLLYTSPKNEKLLLAAMKGHAGYAFAVHETHYLGDFWADKEGSAHLNRAKYHYSKAIRYAHRLYKLKGLDLNHLAELRNDQEKLSLIKSTLVGGEIGIEAAFIGAQAIGGLINLDRTNLTLLAKLPVVKSLFDWTCSLKPRQHFGACDLFYGAYYAGRPRMIGGDPKKGKEIFKKLIEEYPYHLLPKVSYLQFSVIPSGDEKEYLRVSRIIKKEIKQFNRYQIYDGKVLDNPYSNVPSRSNLFHAIAKKRFYYMQKNYEELF